MWPSTSPGEPRRGRARTFQFCFLMIFHCVFIFFVKIDLNQLREVPQSFLTGLELLGSPRCHFRLLNITHFRGHFFCASLFALHFLFLDVPLSSDSSGTLPESCASIFRIYSSNFPPKRHSWCSNGANTMVQKQGIYSCATRVYSSATRIYSCATRIYSCATRVYSYDTFASAPRLY